MYVCNNNVQENKYTVKYITTAKKKNVDIPIKMFRVPRVSYAHLYSLLEKIAHYAG